MKQGAKTEMKRCVVSQHNGHSNLCSSDVMSSQSTTFEGENIGSISLTEWISCDGVLDVPKCFIR